MNPSASTAPSFDDSIWVRSDSKKWIGGVCQGLADSFHWNADWVRIITVIGAVCGFGLLLIAYLVLWISLPKRSEIATAKNSRVFGVCSRISELTGMEVGLVRAIALALLITSLGTTFLIYLVLAVFLPKPTVKPDNLVNF